MTWVKLDDAIGENPKIARLSDSAFALYVTGLAYCNRNLTDGFIPSSVGLGQLRYCEGNAVPAIRELEGGNLWEPADGGWMVHDYPLYQPPKEQVLAERAQKQAAGRAGGLASARARREARAVAGAQAESKPVPVPVPVPLTAEGKGALSAVPDNRPDADQVYLAERIAEAWDKPLGIPALQKLNNAYGRVSVTDALRELHGFPPDDAVRSPFAYLESICTNRESA